MSDPTDTPANPGHASVSPERCDFDLTDPDAFQAVWLTFQRDRRATCPNTDAELELALERDPSEGDAARAEVMVACPACGQRVRAAPPDATEMFGWAE